MKNRHERLARHRRQGTENVPAEDIVNRSSTEDFLYPRIHQLIWPRHRLTHAISELEKGFKVTRLIDKLIFVSFDLEDYLIPIQKRNNDTFFFINHF